MKFSSRSRYGIRAVLVLAERYGEEPVLAKDIADTEKLPPSYLEHIMASLRRADLVSGTRGAKGGYLLTRPPAEISMKDVIVALEGPLQISDCSGGSACCDDREGCEVSALFGEAEVALASVFEKYTVQDILERKQARTGTPMYFI